MLSVEDSVAELKRRLRHEMSQRRRNVAPGKQTAAAVQLCRRLLVLPSLRRAAVVAGYRPTRGEIDPTGALTARHKQGAVVAWPRVGTGRPRLAFHLIASPADWMAGAFGISEPLPTCTSVPAQSVDAFLVPGLAFDARGHRLGWGGGFYDELGAALVCPGRTILVGVAHDFQVVPHCPAGALDVAVDWVVTDKQVIRCDKQKPLTDYSS